MVELEYPERARPAQEIEVAIRLKDPDGAPLAGEVTLWLVDQAVLALGREARLDPLPSFLAAVSSYFSARDTRSLIFGILPVGQAARRAQRRSAVRAGSWCWGWRCLP